MKNVRETAQFTDWMDGLRDSKGRARIVTRVLRLRQGNPGDVEPVGEGVSELRLFFGPGYRVYFGERGDDLIILLAGGDKSSQGRDIELAKRLWRDWREENG